MQSNKIVIGIASDGLELYVDEKRYRLEDEYPEDAAKALEEFIYHVTSDTVKVEIEEIY